MKIVKINSMACPSCIIMNNRFDELKKKYDFESEEIDYDFDDFDYEVGRTLPVFIFLDNQGNELTRLVGEVSLERFESEINKYIER